MKINRFKKYLILVFLLYFTETRSYPLKKITDEVGLYVKKVQLLHEDQYKLAIKTRLIKKLNDEKRDLLKEVDAKGHTQMKLSEYPIDQAFF